MKVIKQSHKILGVYGGFEGIEAAGRTCYKSEDKISEGSAVKFVKMIRKNKHFAMSEFADLVVRFVTNRGVSHELVRHRMCSFAQESTRYVNYGGKPMEFILPVWFPETMLGEWTFDDLETLGKDLSVEQRGWLFVNLTAERMYHKMIAYQVAPERAREILTNALKTEIVVKANFREWRHIFSLRALGETGRPHPQMQSLIVPLRDEIMNTYDEFFKVGEDG